MKRVNLFARTRSMSSDCLMRMERRMELIEGCGRRRGRRRRSRMSRRRRRSWMRRRRGGEEEGGRKEGWGGEDGVRRAWGQHTATSRRTHLDEHPLVLVTANGNGREEHLWACPHFHLGLCEAWARMGTCELGVYMLLCWVRSLLRARFASPATRTIMPLDDLAPEVVERHGCGEGCADAGEVRAEGIGLQGGMGEKAGQSS